MEKEVKKKGKASVVIIVILLLALIGTGTCAGLMFAGIIPTLESEEEVEESTSKKKKNDVNNEVNNKVADNTTNDTTNTNNITNNDNTSSTGMTTQSAQYIAENEYGAAYSNYLEDCFTFGEYEIEGEKTYGYKANISAMKKYFTDKVISQFKNRLIEYNGEFYSIDKEGEASLTTILDLSTIFGLTDQGKRPIKVVAFSDNTIVAKGKLEPGEYTGGDEYPLYIVLVKEGTKWLIDSFE